MQGCIIQDKGDVGIYSVFSLWCLMLLCPQFLSSNCVWPSLWPWTNSDFFIQPPQCCFCSLPLHSSPGTNQANWSVLTSHDFLFQSSSGSSVPPLHPQSLQQHPDSPPHPPTPLLEPHTCHDFCFSHHATPLLVLQLALMFLRSQYCFQGHTLRSQKKASSFSFPSFSFYPIIL